MECVLTTLKRKLQGLVCLSVLLLSACGLDSPAAICIDTHNNLYIADSNHTISKITTDGVFTTIAGVAGVAGDIDGSGSDARFNRPRAIAVDRRGYLYVIDGQGGSSIRKISPSGLVSTLAGKAGNSGSADGEGANARFLYPSSIAVDSMGHVYVTDTYNYTVRKISPDGRVRTLAGSAGQQAHVDASGREARFMAPRGIAVDSLHMIYVTDAGIIRRISPAGQVFSIEDRIVWPPRAVGSSTRADLGSAVGITTDIYGDLYLADASKSVVRKMSSITGEVDTLAGLAGWSGRLDGIGDQARFGSPQSLALDRQGNVYVSDGRNHDIRKINSEGVVSTLVRGSAMARMEVDEEAH